MISGYFIADKAQQDITEKNWSVTVFLSDLLISPRLDNESHT